MWIRPLSHEDALDTDLLHSCLEDGNIYSMASSNSGAYIIMPGNVESNSPIIELLKLHFNVNVETTVSFPLSIASVTQESDSGEMEADLPGSARKRKEAAYSTILLEEVPEDHGQQSNAFSDDPSWKSISSKKRKAVLSKESSTSSLRSKTVLIRPRLPFQLNSLKQLIEDNSHVRRYSVDPLPNGDQLIRSVTPRGAEIIRQILQKNNSYDIIPKTIISQGPESFHIANAKTVPNPALRDSSTNLGSGKTLIVTFNSRGDSAAQVDNHTSRTDFIKQIVNFIESKTNITKFNIRLLERGDYLITFHSPGAKTIVENALQKEKLPFQAVQKSTAASWIRTKTHWEIRVREVPPSINAGQLAEQCGAIKEFKWGRDLILVFTSQSMASQFCTSGILFENMYFRCQPWIRTPLEWKVPQTRCKRCLQEGHTECNEPPKCIKCQQDHLSSQCPEAKAARNRKAEAYAAALGGSYADVVRKAHSNTISSENHDHNAISVPLSVRRSNLIQLNESSSTSLLETIQAQAHQIAELQAQVKNLLSLLGPSTVDPTLDTRNENSTPTSSRDPKSDARRNNRSSLNQSDSSQHLHTKKKTSNYSAVIADLRAKESEMDCSSAEIGGDCLVFDQSGSNEGASYSLSSSRTDRHKGESIMNRPSSSMSAYARAARILAGSSELEGADRATILSLLMDFDRSLDYATDDDAMSSLFD
jgi:hypothetical protein